MNPHDIEPRFQGDLPDVRRMGVMLYDPIWAERDHGASCLEMMHVLRGAMTLVLGPKTYRARTGDTLFVPTGATHRDDFDVEAGLEVFFFGLRWEREEDYFALVDNDDSLGMPAHRKAEVAAEFHHLRAGLAGEEPADKLVARARVHTVLLLILREALRRHEGDATPRDYGAARRRELMRQARAWMEAHYSRPVTLEEIASDLHVSAYYLSHVFSQESDFTLFSYLTGLRMKRAADLLLGGELNVSEVARAVGFEDPNYFSKVFKKHYGRPPSQFAGG